MRTILVTGGAGFIGSNYVHHLLAREAGRVVVLDKLTYAGCRESLADVEGQDRFVFVEEEVAEPTAKKRVKEASR